MQIGRANWACKLGVRIGRANWRTRGHIYGCTIRFVDAIIRFHKDGEKEGPVLSRDTAFELRAVLFSIYSPCSQDYLSGI